MAKLDEMPVKLKILRVRKFRRMMRNPTGNFKVFHIVLKKNVNGLKKIRKEVGDGRLNEILEKYKPLLRDELPPGLPPKRSFNHKIEIEEGGRPPHRLLFQLFMEELKAAKEYVDDLIVEINIQVTI